jgi:pimeloyl-ACP methyl ester carboxylesterase
VAWAVASARPELLRSLTVVSTPHPRALIHAMKTSRQGLRSWYVLFFQLPWLPEALLLAQGGKRLRGTLRKGGLDRAAADAYTAAMREPGALTAALNWYRAMAYGSTGGARRITVPTSGAPTTSRSAGRRPRTPRSTSPGRTSSCR